jgi:hypothetical protein
VLSPGNRLKKQLRTPTLILCGILLCILESIECKGDTALDEVLDTGLPVTRQASLDTAQSGGSKNSTDIDPRFTKGAWISTFLSGGGIDLRGDEDHPDHDLIIGSIQVGYNLTGLVGEKKWYQGFVQLGGEVFVGAQISEPPGFVLGLIPIVSYNFVNGSHWVPYFEAGAGVAYTDIGLPDLSTNFEFIEHAGIGVDWLFRDGLSLRLGSQVMHISNGGIKEPNVGVTTANFLVGLEWCY